jgi:eukaryotic-like serine/threonine-protein kinase
MSRWEQIEQLYHAARERGASVLESAPADLRREVESLLAQDDATALNLLDQASELQKETVTAQPGEQPAVPGTIAPGMQLGPYRIEAPIGQGGMGQVFRATDTRLNRTVAIKTSLTPFDRRFQREAQAIAALNHPNICTLYDVGPNYLVME